MMKSLTPNFISDYLLKFEGIKSIDAWGEKSLFYNPHNKAPRGTYFCTLKEKDGENDKACELNRKGIFRLNFGITKTSFISLFEVIPKRPSKGQIIEGGYDFVKLNTLFPHPIYGWMCWVAILNPSENAFDQLKPLLQESYQLAKAKHQKGSQKAID